MTIEVKRLTPQEWKTLAEDAHQIVFDELWSKDLERIDMAFLMVMKEENKIISYATAQVVDPLTIYLQYGGVFPTYKGTPISFLSFQEMLKEIKKEFSRIVTLVENNNIPMLRFYMKEFFTITGIRYFKNHIFLENTYESLS